MTPKVETKKDRIDSLFVAKEPMGPLGAAVMNMGTGPEHGWHGDAARPHPHEIHFGVFGTSFTFFVYSFCS